ncbi:MAG: hypothetical protein LPK08_08125, partial [Halomonas sp.]|nr:hypothetical protein [Halomonas sp.]MDX5502895.1 hypothetical protein [Halomonas sp.]
MLGKHLIGMALVAGTLPLTVLAQEGPATTEELDNGVVVEESQPETREQALESLDTASEETPEAASFGLETAQEAVSQGGVDGQTISGTASGGRSTEAPDQA